MEILGIGPQELIFIVIIALIVLGPKDMQKAGRTIGQWLNKVVKSDGWKAFQQTSRELRNLPTTLMREANVDLKEAEKDIRKSMKTPPFPGIPLEPNLGPSAEPRTGLPQPPEAENTIQPPPVNANAQAAVPRDASPRHSSESDAESGTANTSDVSTPNQNA